jgi:hypothetical protein
LCSKEGSSTRRTLHADVNHLDNEAANAQPSVMENITFSNICQQNIIFKGESPMSTTITVTYNKHSYQLEYSRNAVKQMEQQGFVLDQIGDKPMTMVPILVYGAFMKNHKGIKRALVDEIYDHIADKVGDGDEGFIQALLEMYSETVNTLTDNSSIDEGNAAIWKVSKG